MYYYSNFHLKKLRLREVKEPDKGNRAKMWQRLDLNPRLSDPKVHVLYNIKYFFLLYQTQNVQH